jgi:MtN3 and saliva related transmembrane protein
LLQNDHGLQHLTQHSTQIVAMSLNLSTFFGYPAAFLTTIAFIPQAWQSWRTRDLSGISLPMYALFTLGVALWLGYGMAIGSLPVIAANAVTLVLASMVLWLKIVEKKHVSKP